MSKSKSGKSRILQPDPQDPSFQSVPADSSQHSSSSGSSSTDLSSSITTAALTTSLSLSITPQVVQIIDTTKWPAPSPDPSGMAYVPGTGLLMVDSEIDETPFFRTDNLFHLSATGVFNSSSSLEGFTVEPTGIVYASPLGHLFISDDDKNRVFEVDANNPGGPPISSFSTKTFATDVEDVAYDPATNHLFVIEGSTGNFNAHTIFETTTTGTMVQSLVLPSTISDPEAIVYDSVNQVFYVSGGFSPNIWVVSRDGQTILNTITVLQNYKNPNGAPAHPKGLTLAPTSNPNDDPSFMSLWVTDYGKDQVMDGRIFEINLQGTALSPLFTTGNDTIDFNTISAGSYQPGTQYDALAGNDTVTLPIDAGAASSAGFDPAQIFKGNDGNDVITGGTLNDIVSGGGGADRILGVDGNDTLTGDGSADTLNGGNGNDSLSGGSSSDTLIGGLGDDRLDGGGGNDTVDYSAAAGAVTIDLGLGTATGDGNDTLISIENVIGSGFSDSITGNTAINNLVGGGGDDTIHGGDGNDVLTGGAGIDQLFGDAGHDTLKWDSQDIFDGGSGFDTLDANFSTADTIDLRGPDFASIERIKTGGGKDTVTLSLDDVLSDTADHQFLADLGSGTDTLKIDTAGGKWTETTADSTLGPTAVAANISVSGLTAHTYTDGVDKVTVFHNAEVTQVI
jgi:Ca2+-binding RTX toxin-like protein